MAENKDEIPTVRFHYQKSSAFRVVRAEGAFGTVNPRGEIIMNIFNERIPIPDYDEFQITEEGNLGRNLHREITSKGIIREVEVAISLDPVTAINFAKWLMDKVEKIEESTGIKFSEAVDEAEREVEENGSK